MLAGLSPQGPRPVANADLGVWASCAAVLL